jgi:hypothetical protein
MVAGDHNDIFSAAVAEFLVMKAYGHPDQR